MSRTLALLLSLALFGTTIGCVRHLAYPGRMDVIEAPTPEVWQYRVLRMRIARSDEELSPKRRNQLGQHLLEARPTLDDARDGAPQLVAPLR